jgi:glucan biosynthesis protein C
MNKPLAITNRQYYLDWIRMITILIVFLFHGGRFFDSDDWHVKNQVVSSIADVSIFFLKEWMMPVFFFISGASTFFALKYKTTAKFLADRVKRILIPLLFGIFILSPPQVYLERFSHHQFTGSLWQFLPHYFEGWYAFGGNFAWMGLHLWYLLLLFIYSFIALPLFLWWKSKSDRRIDLSPYVAFGLMIILLVLPGLFLSLDNILANRSFAGWGMLEYLVIFISGYFAFSAMDIQRLSSENRYSFLFVTIIATGINLYLFLNHELYDFGTASYCLKIALRSLVCYSWIFTILGFGAQYLNYSNPFLRYSNEAVLPFYIAHQPLMLLTGYYVIQANLTIVTKYILIVCLSFALVMLCYQLIIRKINVLRCVFGMGFIQRKMPAASSLKVVD